MYYQRSIDEYLLDWKNGITRKPLLLRGARQVGKTQAVRHLGESFKYFIEANFEKREDLKKILTENIVNKKLDDKGEKVFSSCIKTMHYNAYQYGFIETFINVLFLLPIGYYVYQFIKTGQGVEIIVMIAAIQSKIAELGLQLMALMMLSPMSILP